MTISCKIGMRFYRKTDKIPLRNKSENNPSVNEIGDRIRGIASPNKIPTVSIVIPTFNRSEFLPEALSSALNQTVLADEIIVVDDASTDNTKQVVKDLRPQRRALYPQGAFRRSSYPKPLHCRGPRGFYSLAG